jgi:hypothetical protein
MEQDACREQVRTGIDLLATDLLRAHVVGRANDRTGARDGFISDDPGDSEIGQLDHSLRIPDHIGRFHVTVHQSYAVTGGEAGQQLKTEVECLGESEARAEGKELLDVEALKLLHRDELQVTGRPNLNHPHNVVVLQLRQCPAFALEAFEQDGGFVGCQLGVRVEDLDGHRLAAGLGFSLVNHAHRTLAEFGQHAVAADGIGFHRHGLYDLAGAGAVACRQRNGFRIDAA